MCTGLTAWSSAGWTVVEGARSQCSVALLSLRVLINQTGQAWADEAFRGEAHRSVGHSMQLPAPLPERRTGEGRAKEEVEQQERGGVSCEAWMDNRPAAPAARAWPPQGSPNIEGSSHWTGQDWTATGPLQYVPPIPWVGR